MALGKLAQICRGPGANAVSCLLLRVVEDFERIASEGYTKWSNAAVRELAAAYTCNNAAALLDASSRYTALVYEALHATYGRAVSIDAEVETRLTIHARNPYTPLEIGISWHPILNVPYIPASSLKGAVRAYAEASNIRPCGKAPEELFGTAGGAGLIEITDAYPVKCVDKLIEPDIINPHYREVEGQIGEADVSPTPLLFPTAARGVVFRFFVAPRAEADGKCLTEILDLVRGALAEGIGAKTRLGYGALRF